MYTTTYPSPVGLLYLESDGTAITGLWIKNQKYFDLKRLAKAAHLTEEGCNITSACIQAGFPDYSSFYHAFLKENQKAPSSLLK